MDMTSSGERTLAGESRRDRVEALLRKYPETSSAETAEIIQFLRKGPLFDVGLVTGNDELKPTVERIRREHRSEFSLGIREYALVAAIVIALIVVSAILWN